MLNRRLQPVNVPLLAILLFSTMAATGQAFFPAGAFYADNLKLDAAKAKWYSEQLTALQEPSLFEAKQDSTVQSYRFLWLRSFHHPVAIRVLIYADGSGVVVTKMADGSGGNKPGKLILNKTEPLSPDAAKIFTQRIHQLNYWTLPMRDTNPSGTDGAQWVIEGIDHGTYHLVDRWSPNDGPVRKLGLYFLHDLSGSYLKNEEVY